MAWTITKQTVTDTGIQFELHGSSNDAKTGRPLHVAAVFVPFQTPPPDTPPDVTADALQAARATAIAIAAAQIGDGNTPPAPAGALTRARAALARSRPAATHAAAATAGGGLAQLLAHLLA